MKPTICLVMIVKNDIKTLPRCFDSVKDLIDCYCISDIDSTDGTPEFIINYWNEKRINGIVHHDKWMNFGHNRTMAVQHAMNMADYLLLLDSNQQVIIKDDDIKSKIPHGIDILFTPYACTTGWGGPYRGGASIHLLKASRKWEFKGRLHEYLSYEKETTTTQLSDAFTVHDLICTCALRRPKF
jgi:hypothetical protein